VLVYVAIQPIAPAPESAPPGGELVDVTPAPEPDSEDVTSAALQDLESPAEEPAHIDLVQVSDSVAYMRRLHGEVIAVYVGANNKQKLRNWGDWLCCTHSVTQGYELREAKRLNAKWELKLTPMTQKQIERLAACDFTKDPRSSYPDAPKRPAPRIVEVGDIGVGDRVRSVTVKHWEYTVTGINSDGFFECDRLGTNPVITQVLHPGSVELVHKIDVVDVVATELAEHLEQQVESIAPTPTIDETDVPRGVILRPTSDDMLVEYLVYAWVVVRNQGKPEPCQKHFGRIVEGLGKIEVYKPVSGRYQAFATTMDAVNFLISASDYSTSDIDAGVELYESRTSQKVLVGAAGIEEPDF